MNIIKNWMKIRKNKELYKNAKNTLIARLDEWVARMQGKPFHGGEHPDEADFEVNYK